MTGAETLNQDNNWTVMFRILMHVTAAMQTMLDDMSLCRAAVCDIYIAQNKEMKFLLYDGISNAYGIRRQSTLIWLIFTQKMFLVHVKIVLFYS